MKRNLLARWIEKVAYQEDTGCWFWTSTIDREGYGRIKVNGRQEKAHRVGCELIVGKIAKGMVLDHECARGDASRRKCVNPFHVDVVTQKVNASRIGHPLKLMSVRQSSIVSPVYAEIAA